VTIGTNWKRGQEDPKLDHDRQPTNAKPACSPLAFSLELS
jgi:hypothetical protein